MQEGNLEYLPLISHYCSPEQISALLRLVTDSMTENERIMSELLTNDEEDMASEQEMVAAAVASGYAADIGYNRPMEEEEQINEEQTE
jgi:hypothetical protein